MEKINLVELLKGCPKGMELESPMYDNLVFCEIDSEAQDYPIITQLPGGVQKWFTSDGRYELNPNAKCVIFPKGKTTWEGFHRPFKDGDILYIDANGDEDEDGCFKYTFILKVLSLTVILQQKAISSPEKYILPIIYILFVSRPKKRKRNSSKQSKSMVTSGTLRPILWRSWLLRSLMLGI